MSKSPRIATRSCCCAQRFPSNFHVQHVVLRPITMCVASSSGFGGSVTSTLQHKIRVPWHGCARCHPSQHSCMSACFGPPYRDRMGLRRGSARRTGNTSKSLLEGGDKRNAFLKLLSAEHPKAVKQVHWCEQDDGCFEAGIISSLRAPGPCGEENDVQL